MSVQIPIDRLTIARFCRRWAITEFALFGSVLRDDFGPGSDVDVLVTFSSGATWSLLDLMTMRDELATIFARSVDVVEKQALRNPFRRHAILTNHEVLYAA